MASTDSGALSAHDVAAELRRRRPFVGGAKLHKLLYYCQGWHLAWSGEPLFHQRVHAWANGPVVADVWHDEKKSRYIPPARPLPDAALATVGYVVAKYGHLSGKELIHLTHAERPWIDVSERDDGSDEITAEALVSFFRDELGAAGSTGLSNDSVNLLRQAAAVMREVEPVPDDLDEIQRRLTALRQ